MAGSKNTKDRRGLTKKQNRQPAANGLTLVTHNTREFSRVEGLALEDWTEV